MGDIALHTAEKNVCWPSLGHLVLDTRSHVKLEGEERGEGGGGGSKRRREERQEEERDITLFKSVGCAVQDIATAEFVFQRAQKMGLGTQVEM